MRRPPSSLWVIVLILCAIDVGILSWVLMHSPTRQIGSMLTLLVVSVATLLSTRFKFYYQGLGVTPTLAFETAAVILVGPWWAFWIAQAAILMDLLQNWRRYTRLQRLFNLAQMIITSGLGMGVVTWLWGVSDPFDYRSVMHLGAVVIGMSVYFGSSALLVALAISLSTRKPFLPFLTHFLSTGTLYTVLLIPVGVVLAALYTLNPVLALILLLLILQMHTTGELKSRLAKEAQATIETMARLVDERDRYTHEHSKRVATYAHTIGQAMGLSGQQLDCLRRGCLVHDIGKVVLSDAVLKGEGRLTSDQWEEMKRHPEVGYQLVKDLDPYRDCAMIVRHHHERFDGTGYPAGLSGQEIPLLARIAGVADAFDAMTSRRSYRQAVPAGDALEELVRHAGTQFDPAVVSVAVGVLPEAFRNRARTL